MYHEETKTRTAKTDRPSKKFESDFSGQFRSYGLSIERILDLGWNQVVCDYYAVIEGENALGLPGMACFFELITTSEAELPLTEVEPYILDELARYCETLPEIHAGFLINFRGGKERRIVYISGSNLKNYTERYPNATTLPNNDLDQVGIPMPMLKEGPRSRKCLKMDIPAFLLEIHKADLSRQAAMAA